MTWIIVDHALVSMIPCRLLVALADTGSVARAADVVGVVQPHASRTLRRLSEHHGTSLTEPAGRGVRLTEAGLRLAERARAVVADFDALDTAAQPPARTLRAAAHEPLSSLLLGGADWSGESSVVRILDLAPGEIEQALARGTADVGLTTLPAPDRAVEHASIGRWELRPCVGAQLARVAANRLPWILPVAKIAAGPVAPVTIDGWPADAPRRDTVAEVTNLSTAIELAVRGLGAVWIPTCAAAAHNAGATRERQLTIRTERSAPRAEQAVYLATPVDAPLDPVRRDRLTTSVLRFIALGSSTPTRAQA